MSISQPWSVTLPVQLGTLPSQSVLPFFRLWLSLVLLILFFYQTSVSSTHSLPLSWHESFSPSTSFVIFHNLPCSSSSKPKLSHLASQSSSIVPLVFGSIEPIYVFNPNRINLIVDLPIQQLFGVHHAVYTTNIHQMHTRSKYGVLKPKTYMSITLLP